jgi:creatinine amidohydrolase/Fe(II)-dependent formamide hydrolase-like protein
VDDGAERAAMMREGAYDFHAGFMETSLALHYAPESVDPIHRKLPPCPEVIPNARLLSASRTAARFGRAQLARELRFAAVALGWHALRPFPAYTSRPHRASAEAGATIAAHVVREFARVTDRVLRGEEAAPAPIMPWIAPATLGGTLATDSIPLDAIARFDAAPAAS